MQSRAYSSGRTSFQKSSGAAADATATHRGGITHLAELQQDDVGYLKKRRQLRRWWRSAAGSR